MPTVKEYYNDIKSYLDEYNHNRKYKFLAFSLWQIEGIRHFENYNISCISILSPDHPKKPVLSDHISNILSLRFDDLNETEIRLIGRLKDKLILKQDDIDILFSDIMASQIIDFVDDNLDSDAIIVHCHYGLSRSAGVVLALEECYNQYKFIHPNHEEFNDRVRDKVIAAYEKKRAAA